jgi:hypothetical protein
MSNIELLITSPGEKRERNTHLLHMCCHLLALYFGCIGNQNTVARLNISVLVTGDIFRKEM